METNGNHDTINVKEAAELLGVCRQTLWRWTHEALPDAFGGGKLKTVSKRRALQAAKGAIGRRSVRYEREYIERFGTKHGLI